MEDILKKILERLDTIDGGQSKTNERLDSIDVRLNGIDVRLNGIDVRLNGIDGQIEGMNARLDSVEEDISELRDDMSVVKNDVKVLKRKTTNIEKDLKAAWGDILKLDTRLGKSEEAIQRMVK